MALLTKICELPTVVDLLGRFDFLFSHAPKNTDWIQLIPSQPFTAIAGDGAGGVFLAYGTGEMDSLPLLYASSEGQAGTIAASLPQFIALLVAIPYWQSLLHFSGGGDVNEMRIAARFLEREHQNCKSSVETCRAISDALSIDPLIDPITVLHQNVRRDACKFSDGDGGPYSSLFNTFVAQNNPKWAHGSITK